MTINRLTGDGRAVRVISAAYILQGATDDELLVSGQGGPITLLLPAAVPSGPTPRCAQGDEYVIETDGGAGANPVTVAMNGAGSLINGAASIVLGANQRLTVTCFDGVNYRGTTGGSGSGAPSTALFLQPIGSTPLAVGMLVGDLTMVVAAPALFAAIAFPFNVLLESEVIQVTGGAGTLATPYTVVRAQNATAAAAHALGVAVIGDDWNPTTGVMAQIAAQLASGASLPVLMAPGIPATAPWLTDVNYHALSRQQLPSKSVIYGTPNTRVQASLANINLFDAPFDALYTTTGPAIILVTPNVKGSNVITMPNVGAMVVGSQFFINRSPAFTHGAIFEIVSIAGAGPFTVTVDRPVLYAFNAGSMIAPIATRPTDIKIYGNGMHIFGTAGVFIEIAGGLRCHITDITLDGNAGNTATSGMIYDTGNFQCVVERMNALGPFVQGFQFIGENVTARDCRVGGNEFGGPTQGILVIDAVNCELDTCNAESAVGVGILVSTDGAFGVGTPSEGIRIVNCSAIGNGAQGLTMVRGTFNVDVLGGSYQYNTSGCSLDPPFDGAVHSIAFVGVDLSNNSSVGLQTTVGAKAISATRINVSGGAATVGLQPRDDMTIQGVECEGTVTAIQCIGGAGTKVTIEGFDIRGKSAGFTGITIQGAGQGRISDGYIDCPLGGSIGIFSIAGSGAWSCDNVVVGGAGPPAIGLDVQSPNTFRVNQSNDFDVAGTPTVFAAGSHISKEQITANGAAVVTSPWPDLKSTDRVYVKLHTLAGLGAPPPLPVVVETPGVGYSIQSIAGDTSVYDAEIS